MKLPMPFNELYFRTPMKKRTVSNTTADPTVPKVLLALDGEEYFLTWDFNSIARAESLTGLNLLFAVDLDPNISAGQLRGLLWAALQKFQPEMTLDQVGGMIHPRHAKTIIRALNEAFHGSQPDPEKKDEKSPNAETPETSN